MTADFSLVLDAQCALAESPVWWAEAGVLVFIDITGRRLHRFDPQSGRHEVDARTLVASHRRGVAAMSPGCARESGYWAQAASSGAN
jgi:sugar lactone lactonase YvrE